MNRPVTKVKLTRGPSSLGQDTFQKLNYCLQILMQSVFSSRAVENVKSVSLTYFTPCMSAGYLLFVRYLNTVSSKLRFHINTWHGAVAI